MILLYFASQLVDPEVSELIALAPAQEQAPKGRKGRGMRTGIPSPVHTTDVWEGP